MRNHIRPALEEDLARVAEIEVFNFRLNFYPIFQDDQYYFDELQVPKKIAAHRPFLHQIWVYDDGVIKGFVKVADRQIQKLYVEPILQGGGIGAELLEHAIRQLDAVCLWALEKNTRAIAFYQRHGFHLTGEKQPEEDTAEYLVRLER